jgi:hypothetical protein
VHPSIWLIGHSSLVNGQKDAASDQQPRTHAPIHQDTETRMTPDNPRLNGEPDELDAADDENEPQADAFDYINEEAQKRLWVRSIIPLLQLRSHDSDPSGRVQLAFDLMHIAACERMARILRDDLQDNQK